MRCGCPACGTYMVQSERGLESGCVYPACLAVCRACMGEGARVLTPEAIRRLERAEGPDGDEDWPEKK